MIPDYQTLMRPVLSCAANNEVRIGAVVDRLAEELGLTPEEQEELLPSGTQTRFTNRVHWAKAYLAKAGLVENTRRGYFQITQRGKAALSDAAATINNAYLDQFKEFQDFKTKVNVVNASHGAVQVEVTGLLSPEETPDEALRKAHASLTGALSADLLERVRLAKPNFFEHLIVELLLAMGYGGSSEEAGRALGQSGDDGVDGVIDQDPLGVDQIYVQAKRYAEGNNIGAGAIRDFYGALSLKKATKGIFVTPNTQMARRIADRSIRLVCKPATGVPKNLGGVGVRWGLLWQEFQSRWGAQPQLNDLMLMLCRPHY